MTRLRGGSFSAREAANVFEAASPVTAGNSARAPQTLLSIALVAVHAEARTLVISRPAVNSLRINKSRSTDGGNIELNSQELFGWPRHGSGNETHLDDEHPQPFSRLCGERPIRCDHPHA